MWTETAASEKLHFRSTMLDEYVFHAAISVVYKYGVQNRMWTVARKFSVAVTDEN